MRCLYCHNRDTWDLKGGKEDITVDELMKELAAYKHYIMPNGGVTASGGEAILQAKFVREWFTACHMKVFTLVLIPTRLYTPL